MDDSTEQRYQKMKTVAEHYKVREEGGERGGDGDVGFGQTCSYLLLLPASPLTLAPRRSSKSVCACSTWTRHRRRMRRATPLARTTFTSSLVSDHNTRAQQAAAELDVNGN